MNQIATVHQSPHLLHYGANGRPNVGITAQSVQDEEACRRAGRCIVELARRRGITWVRDTDGNLVTVLDWLKRGGLPF